MKKNRIFTVLLALLLANMLRFLLPLATIGHWGLVPGVWIGTIVQAVFFIAYYTERTTFYKVLALLFVLRIVLFVCALYGIIMDADYGRENMPLSFFTAATGIAYLALLIAWPILGMVFLHRERTREHNKMPPAETPQAAQRDMNDTR